MKKRTKRRLKRIAFWSLMFILLSSGVTTGFIVGKREAAIEFTQMVEVLSFGFKKELREFKDSLPSDTVSCAGKPEPCRMRLSNLQEMVCAVWKDDPTTIRSYCILLNKNPFSEIIPKTKEPGIKT